MLRYFLQVYGCQMNQNEAGLVRAILDESGHVETSDEADAELFLMLTCTVRSHAEARALGRLGSMRGHRGQGRGRAIAVLGCMAETAGEVLAAEHGVDIVLGPDRYRLLPGAVARVLNGDGPVIETGAGRECYEGIFPAFPGSNHKAAANRASPGNAAGELDERAGDDRRRCTDAGDSSGGVTRVRGSVVAMRGCDNWCTYCVVPLARGRERSRSLGQVVEECRRLADQGVRDITLLGQNVLAWREGARDFVGLLEAVARTSGLARLRFLTSHPGDFSERVARAMATIPAVCPDLHLPVQSGSDRILEKMNRRYTRAEYLDRVSIARELMPGLGVSTDLLVGFPGETEADFLATLDLVRQVRFDAGYTFRYSLRPGTAAGRMGPKVSEAEAGDRLARLIGLQNRVTSEKARETVGSEVEVLIEARASRGSGMLGRTRSNRTIVVESPVAVGDTVVVSVTGIRGRTPVAHSVKVPAECV